MGGGKAGGNAPSDKQMRQMGGPWQPLQDPVQNLIPGFQNLKKYGYGPSVVEGFSPEQQAALASGQQMGATGSPFFQGATDYAGNVASGAGVGASPGYGAISNVAEQGVNNPVYGSLMKNLQLAEGGSGGLDYAKDVVSGKYLNSNPNLENVVNASVNDARNSLLPSLEGRMSMAGRLGSNAEAVGQGEIAKKLGEVASGIRYGDYQNERGMQQAAGMALPSLLGQEVGTRNTAAGAVSDDVYSRLQQQLGAGLTAAGIRQGDVSQALQGGSQLGQNFQNQFAGVDRSLQYGGMGQAQQERQNQEAQDQFRFNQDARYQQLQRMLGGYQGIAGMTNPAVATQYAQNQANQPSGFQTGLGNLLNVAGTGAQIGGMFMGGPAGAAAAGMGTQALQNMLMPRNYSTTSGMFGGA